MGIALLSGVVAGNLAAALVSTLSDQMPFQLLAGLSVGFGLIVALTPSSPPRWVTVVFPLTGAGFLAAGLFQLTETSSGGTVIMAVSILAGLLAAVLTAWIAAIWARLLTKTWRVSTLLSLTPWTGVWALIFTGVAIVIGSSSLGSVGSSGWVAFGAAGLATLGAVFSAGSSQRIPILGWAAATGTFALAGVALLTVV